MSTPSSSPTHTIQHFLSTTLSQRGPTSLPYTETHKFLIRHHLLSLSQTYPSLQPKSATYTHNDGRSLNLLQSSGTLPILYNNVTYNIPIIIWLLESYPNQPPLVYVNPTRDMIIKRNHPFVNPSGVVSINYLDNWIYPSSNLVDLANNLSHFFGRDPPLYSRPRPNQNPNPNPTNSINSYNWPRPNPNHNPNATNSINSYNWPRPNPNPNPNPSATNSINSYNPDPNTNTMPISSSFPSSVNNLGARPAIPPRPYPVSPYGGGGGGKYMDDPAEVFKRNAMNKLVENLYGDVSRMRKGREGEMEGLFNVQGVLREREGELFKGLKEMEDEKERLEERLQMVLMNGDVLEGWLRENEGKVEVLRNVEVDDAFENCDVLSKQMLECTASDLALEDVIYALDKAVQEGGIKFDQYLRNVRMLSREQFIHRATASKVRAVQMQAQVSNMASRAPASAYAL